MHEQLLEMDSIFRLSTSFLFQSHKKIFSVPGKMKFFIFLHLH